MINDEGVRIVNDELGKQRASERARCNKSSGIEIQLLMICFLQYRSVMTSTVGNDDNKSPIPFAPTIPSSALSSHSLV